MRIRRGHFACGNVHLAAQMLDDADAEQNNDVRPEARLCGRASGPAYASGLFRHAILPLRCCRPERPAWAW